MKQEKGFLILAQNSPGVDYVGQARVLARSIRQSQSQPVGVSLVTDQPVAPGDEFEYVIQLRQDDAQEEGWKIHNKWQLFELSPYERTIWLDSDMVIPTDVSWWWEQLHGTPIRFASRPLDFRAEPINRHVYRHVWVKKNLPMVYTGLVYFDRSPQARRLFDAARKIFLDWPAVASRYRIKRPVSGDLVFSLAVKKFRAFETVPEIDDFFTFVHMKPKSFRMEHRIEPKWIDSLSLHFDGGTYIEGFRQDVPIHYVDKDLPEAFDHYP